MGRGSLVQNRPHGRRTMTQQARVRFVASRSGNLPIIVQLGENCYLLGVVCGTYWGFKWRLLGMVNGTYWGGVNKGKCGRTGRLRKVIWGNMGVWSVIGAPVSNNFSQICTVIGRFPDRDATNRPRACRVIVRRPRGRF